MHYANGVLTLLTTLMCNCENSKFKKTGKPCENPHYYSRRGYAWGSINHFRVLFLWIKIKDTRVHIN